MLELCKTMMSNNAVSSCGALVPSVVDQILKRGKCTGSEGAYICPQDMMGLCNVYLKNQEILSCQNRNDRGGLPRADLSGSLTISLKFWPSYLILDPSK
jgi:hypothetical protein